MMKILKNILIVFLILVVLLSVGLFIFIKTFDIQKYKPMIVSQIQNALGRQVTLGNIQLTLSMKEGLNLKLNDLVVEDRPQFQSGNMLEVKEVALGVDLMGFLTKQQLTVGRVLVKSPQVNVVRNADNQINLQTIGPVDAKGSSSNQSSSSESNSAASAAVALPVVLVKQIVLDQGAVRFTDKLEAMPMNIAVEQLNLKVNDFSLDRPFHFVLEGAALHTVKNFKIDGQGQLKIPSNEVRFSNVKTSIDLQHLSFERIRQAFPTLQSIPWPEKLVGVFEVNLKDLTAGAQGVGQLVMDISLKNASVDIKNVAPGIHFKAEQLGLDITQFSLDKPFTYQFSGAVYSDKPNIQSKGKGTFQLERQMLTIQQSTVDMDLAKFSIGTLQSNIEPLSAVPMPEKISGQINSSIEELVASPVGLTRLLVNGQLNAGMLQLKELAVPIEAIAAKFQLTEADVTLNQLSLNLAEGLLTASAKIVDYLKVQNFTSDMDLDNIKLEKVLNQSSQPVKLQGTLFGQFKFEGQGFAPETMLQSLKGTSQIQLKDGRLTDINILKTVLDKISIIPNAAQKIEASLPENFKDKLQQKDTVLNKVNLLSRIENGRVLIEPMEVEADGFLMKVDGSTTLDQQLDLTGRFSIPPDLSAKIVDGTSELSYLLDSGNRISMPIKIKGKFPNLSYFPDLGDMGRQMIENKGKQELNKLLNKVLKKDDDSVDDSTIKDSNPSNQPQPGSRTPKPEKRPEEQILEGLFDKVFN